MLHTLISLSTLAALLLHLGLGCCAHHEHSADGNSCRHAHRGLVAESADGAHAHEGAGGHHYEPLRQIGRQTASIDESMLVVASAPRKPCNGAACVFVMPNKADFVTLAGPFVGAFYALNDKPLEDASAVAGEFHDSGGALWPTLRRHLLLRVLLI